MREDTSCYVLIHVNNLLNNTHIAHNNPKQKQKSNTPFTDRVCPLTPGAARFSQIPYVFGYPFMNETVVNETELVMRQWYDYEDRNMSDCTMMMWTNFIKYT